MTWTALETIPSLSGKSRETRLLFAEVANTALAKGRTKDEAIFQGLASVQQREKQEVKKYIKPSVPRHLQALLDIRDNPNLRQEAQQQLEIEKQAQATLEAGKEVVGLNFDPDGRLTLKFKDGKKLTSNVAPITAVEHNVIVVGDTNTTSASNEIITGLKTLTYNGADLERVDEPDGSYKLLTYVGTVLTQVDHVQATQTIRYTLNYTADILTSVNTEII